MADKSSDWVPVPTERADELRHGLVLIGAGGDGRTGSAVYGDSSGEAVLRLEHGSGPERWFVRRGWAPDPESEAREPDWFVAVEIQRCVVEQATGKWMVRAWDGDKMIVFELCDGVLDGLDITRKAVADRFPAAGKAP